MHGGSSSSTDWAGHCGAWDDAFGLDWHDASHYDRAVLSALDLPPATATAPQPDSPTSPPAAAPPDASAAPPSALPPASSLIPSTFSRVSDESKAPVQALEEQGVIACEKSREVTDRVRAVSFF